ncbi:uncharacterized protein LOC114351503 [Ostrinia furnacalis]|uniref:uncharacterized protein LOC114351503 n=1 Tax=Ostrinia furnacalis TaxID=93504 RepID=UPI00103B80CE|nr:uncharacterized protein LOC114351503 [Ostrinia furnacalis]
MQQIHLILLLWYSTTYVDGNTEISPIPSNSGLYFQNDGDVLITDDSWKLVIYRNLEPLFLSRDSLKRLAYNYQTLISRYPNLPSTITTSSYIKLNLDKIDTRLDELSLYTNNKRTKRELLDGLSSLLKWLIGTPDAKDAKHYDECIQLLEKQQITTNEILNQQLQIISSTITNFNETILKISYDEHLINENLAKINSYFNSTNKILFNLTISEEMSTVAIQILEAVTSLEKDIDDIISSILFIKSGAIHPSIISTNRLYKELLSTGSFRSNRNLVASVTLSNIHQILESASISSYIYMNKLVYVLKFPLVINDKFTLYHLYSIPISHPDSSLYSTILPERTYIATSTTRQQYAITNSLADCKTFTSNTKVCKFIVYNVNARPTCEMSILSSTSRNVPDICEVATFSAYINTFQEIKSNKWIFILQHKTPYALECGDKTTHSEISGTGIISLEENCKMYTALTTISAENGKTYNTSHPIITVDLETICIPEYSKQEPSLELIPIKINNIPLDSLKH